MIQNEETRRKINLNYDTEPSESHFVNLKLSKAYIRNKKVLDIGCWTGIYEVLAKKYTKSLSAIDPNEQAIEYAKKHISGVYFSVGTAENMTFPLCSFDVITLFDVLEHIPEQNVEDAIRKINAILKKDGYLIISTPYASFFSILLDPAYFMLKHRHYSQEQLTEILNNCGFQIKQSQTKGGLVRLLWVNVELVFKHIFKIKIFTPKFIKKIIESEYRSKGMASIYVIAQKIS